jgi:hypothetical protein
MALLDLVQTHNFYTLGNNSYCSGRSLSGFGTSPFTIEENGTPGTAQQAATFPGQGSNLIGYLSGGPIDQYYNWNAGTYTWRLNVTGSNMNITLTEVHICRISSGGTNLATVGSATGLGISCSSTGVKSGTVTGTAQSHNPGDNIIFLFVFSNGSMSQQTLNITPDQIQNTPIDAAPTTILTADSGSYYRQGYSITFRLIINLIASQGIYNLTGQNVSFTLPTNLIADQGNYTTTGQSIAFILIQPIQADQGNYITTGQSIAFILIQPIPADQGNYTTTGQSISFTLIQPITADQGTYTTTGQSISFTLIQPIPADQGTYTTTGQIISFTLIQPITADQGTYTTTGQSISFTLIQPITADQGTYTTTGQSISFTLIQPITADQGTYTTTGQSISFTLIQPITADQGTYTTTGQSILIYTDTSLLVDAGTYNFIGNLIGITGPTIPGLYPIDNTQLNLICQFYTTTKPPFYSLVQSAMQDLYNTGCRPSEIIKFDLWQQDPGNSDNWQLQPLKGNNIRTIPKNLLSDSLNYAIQNQIKPYQGLTVRQIEYSMKQIAPFGVVTTDDKFAICYCFRYNKVRLLLAEGYDQSFISQYFGWIEPTIQAQYSYRQLYIYYNDLPAETFFISNINQDILIDNDNSIILSQ